MAKLKRHCEFYFSGGVEILLKSYSKLDQAYILYPISISIPMQVYATCLVLDCHLYLVVDFFVVTRVVYHGQEHLQLSSTLIAS